jgi:hypothetical protein
MRMVVRTCVPLVLVIGIGSTVEKKLGAIGATERDGVKVVIKALIRP